MINICNAPVRSSKFVARKNWIITGSDDGQIRIYSDRTFEQVRMFKAHTKIIRCIAVHSTESYVISSSGIWLNFFLLEINGNSTSNCLGSLYP